MSKNKEKDDNSWEELDILEEELEEEQSEKEEKAPKDDLEDEEEEIEEEPVEDEAEEDSSEEGEVQTDEEEEAEEEKPRKSSRAAKRIQQLLEKDRAKEAELVEIRAKLAAVEEESFNTKKSNISAQKDQLKTALTSKKDAYKKAAEENNYEQMAEINSEMTKLNVKYEALEAFESKQPTKFEKKETKKENSIPAPAQDWLEENGWFNTDPVKRMAAITVNNDLINEGYDPNSEVFYKKVTSELNKKYSGLFGTDEKKGVKSVVDKKSSEDDSEDTSSQKTLKSKKTHRQIVSGGSRTSQSNKSVSLTREEYDLAESYDMTPEEYQKYKKKAEKTDQNGYSIID